MKIDFVKYQGTGNDFVMLDNMSGKYDSLNISQIQFLCDRKLGIGADGLIKISKDDSADFYVDYFNADGTQSFCGNGARCSTAFAKKIGIIDSSTRFNAIDGFHKAEISNGIVRLEMLDVDKIDRINNDYFVDTGSPHYVHLSSNNDMDIVTYGKMIRYSEDYVKEGVNVNYLIEKLNISIRVETYERGVEDETLSCGTGVTACGLIQMANNAGINRVEVETKGGHLSVEAQADGNGGFSDIWLSGPATEVFHGAIEI
ncbi:MAG: diaminopimelate epimerase [Crocinitomicaceae bacterium]|nr:diaminopimelate epimerase [Crocinitomicaceae bacterium]